MKRRKFLKLTGQAAVAGVAVTAGLAQAKAAEKTATGLAVKLQPIIEEAVTEQAARPNYAWFYHERKKMALERGWTPVIKSDIGGTYDKNGLRLFQKFRDVDVI